jgi:hypothetical protein
MDVRDEHVRLFATIGSPEQPSRRVEWALTFRLVPTIRFATRMDLGICSVRTSGPIRKTLTIDAASSVASIRAEVPKRWNCEVTETPGRGSMKRFTAVIDANVPQTVGALDERINLIPVANDGTARPAKALRVLGQVVQDVVPSPYEINLGLASLGSTAKEAVELTSLARRPFHVVRFTSKKGVLAEPVLGQENAYEFRISIDKSGDQLVNVDFLIRDELGSEFILSVPIRYRGSEPTTTAGMR